MTRQYIGTTPVVASVHSATDDTEWLFTDKFQARVLHADLTAMGATNLTYKEHN